MKRYLVLFAIFAVIFSSCKDKKSKSSEPFIQDIIVPESFEEDSVSIENDTINSDSLVVEEEAIFEESSSSAVSYDSGLHKYFLISGSFVQYDNAQRYQQQLISEGYQSEIIERPEGPNGQFYKVSYMGFSSWNKAIDQYRSDRYQDGKEDVWILVKN